MLKAIIISLLIINKMKRRETCFLTSINLWASPNAFPE